MTVTIVASGSIATAAVIGGSAQIAQSNIFTVVLAHARGIPLVLIAPGGQNNPASPNLDLFVLRDGPIKTAKDLEGRTLGVTSVHDQQSLGARALIEAAGWDLKKTDDEQWRLVTRMLGLLRKHRAVRECQHQP